MRKQMTIIRLQILFAILHINESKQNAASIAKSLHISKSTVSRAIETFEQDEILYKERLHFTPIGKKFVEDYWNKKEALKKWLMLEEGLVESMAERDALSLLLSMRSEALDAIIKKIKVNTENAILTDLEGFSDKCIDYLLDDGIYSIPFTIYKSNLKKFMKVSMANNGFHHPGVMIIKNGIGTIYLTSKRVYRPPPVGKGLLSGSVDSMSYLTDQRFEKAIFDGRQWSFPTAFVNFTYNKGERVLTGITTLKLGCTAGNIYMPESTALLSLSISF